MIASFAIHEHAPPRCRFYVAQIRTGLGPLWSFLPEGALDHVPYAYLHSTQAVPRVWWYSVPLYHLPFSKSIRRWRAPGAEAETIVSAADDSRLSRRRGLRARSTVYHREEASRLGRHTRPTLIVSM